MPHTFSCPDILGLEASYYFCTDEQKLSARVYPHHLHDFIEFYILLEGDVSFAIESSVYKMNSGDAVVIKPNEMHNCILNNNSPHKHICFWFNCDNEFLFGDFLKHEFGKNNLISPSEENKARLLSIYCELEIATGKNDKQRLLYLSLEMLDIFRKSLSLEVASKPLPPLLKEILADIDLNFREISSINEVAKRFFISQSTLIRIFKANLRTTPKQYIETKKLSCARRLLKNGASVNYACLQAGFTDCSNFIRLFKKQFSLTPHQYRKL